MSMVNIDVDIDIIDIKVAAAHLFVVDSFSKDGNTVSRSITRKKTSEKVRNVRKRSKTSETSENVQKVRFFSCEGHATPIC